MAGSTPQTSLVTFTTSVPATVPAAPLPRLGKPTRVSAARRSDWGAGQLGAPHGEEPAPGGTPPTVGEDALLPMPEAEEDDVLTRRFVMPPEVLLVPVSKLSPRARRALGAESSAGSDCSDEAEGAVGLASDSLPGNALSPTALPCREDGVAEETNAGAARCEQYAVGRVRSRRPQSLVNGSTAALLREFRQPRRLVDAVLHYSSAEGCDPEAVLEAAFPALERCVNHRILVLEGEEELETLEPSLAPGELFAGYEAVRLVHLLEDVEVVQARETKGELVALKLARQAPRSVGGAADFADGGALKIAREAHCLELLSAGTTPVCPKLLAVDLDGHQPFLAMQWCEGTTLSEYAAELRLLPRRERSQRQLQLCRDLAAAYAQLHAHGVVHSDVHPGNVMVRPDGSVALIDFGAARVLEEGSPWANTTRAAVGFFFDPALAEDLLAGREPRQADPLSDQYALGALIYFAITGQHYLAFRAEQGELLRQVRRDLPRGFVQCGSTPWPALEAVLRRALAKEPGERFESVAAFAAALAAVEPAPKPRRGAALLARRLENAFIERYCLRGPLAEGGLERAPTASLAGGGAGAAWFLLHAARRREDARLLALADSWASRAALEWSRRADGFVAASRGLIRERIGTVSVLHTASGAHWVQAAVAAARGDVGCLSGAVERFVAAVEPASARGASESTGDAGPEVGSLEATSPGRGALACELALGGAGVLLAAQRLQSWCRELGPAAVRERAERLLVPCIAREIAKLRELVCSSAALEAHPELPHFGLAHGWAGVLLALLRSRAWKQVEQEEQPDRELCSAMGRRLQELASLAQQGGDEALWPGTSPQLRALGATPDCAPGWCAGSAGHAVLLAETRAHEEFRVLVDEQLLLRAAQAVWRHRSEHADLCCGLAGRALALQRVSEVTGDEAWSARGRELAQRAVRRLQGSESRLATAALPAGLSVAGSQLDVDSLWKGALGTVLVGAALEGGTGAAGSASELLPLGW